MKIQSQVTRREEILKAAFEVVIAYGFRRTSMQDIADAVGISRPALYLEFKNKTEIFRAVAAGLFDQNAQEARDVFGSKQGLEEKLLAVLNSGFADFHNKISNTPHGEELLSIKQELAGDIYLSWLDEMKSIIEDGIRLHMDARNSENNANINVTDIAAIMVNTMHGVKSRSADHAEILHNARSVVSLVLATLTPK